MSNVIPLPVEYRSKPLAALCEAVVKLDSPDPNILHKAEWHLDQYLKRTRITVDLLRWDYEAWLRHLALILDRTLLESHRLSDMPHILILIALLWRLRLRSHQKHNLLRSTDEKYLENLVKQYLSHGDLSVSWAISSIPHQWWQGAIIWWVSPAQSQELLAA